MSEQKHLADTIRRAYEGDAWHGPSLSEVLAGVSSAEASVKEGDTHSIWELTLHITAWLDIARRRMEGEVLGDHNLTMQDDWPPVPSTVTDTEWHATLQSLAEANRKLCEAVANFPDDKLEAQVPGRDYSYSVMLHGVAQHASYHAGQIQLLKRLRNA